MKHAILGLLSLFLLSACSSSPPHASFSSASNPINKSDSCTALGYMPGTPGYDQCQQEARIREEVVARKAINGNKNQPDGVLAQTYGRGMGVMINCTSYATHSGGPSLCD